MLRGIMRIIGLQLFHTLLVSGIILCAYTPATAQKADCLDCHKDLTEGKVVHAAVGMGCGSCHKGVDASDIPHKFAGGNKGLSPEPPDLCYKCHFKDEFTKKDQHSPVAGGMCMTCHVPHSSPNDALLKKAGNQLCLDCHEIIEKKPHVVAGPIPRGHVLSGRRDPNREGKPFGCVSCHAPHSSAWGKLYRYEGQKPSDLCKNCHEFLQ